MSERGAGSSLVKPCYVNHLNIFRSWINLYGQRVIQLKLFSLYYSGQLNHLNPPKDQTLQDHQNRYQPSPFRLIVSHKHNVPECRDDQRRPQNGRIFSNKMTAYGLVLHPWSGCAGQGRQRAVSRLSKSGLQACSTPHLGSQTELPIISIGFQCEAQRNYGGHLGRLSPHSCFAFELQASALVYVNPGAGTSPD